MAGATASPRTPGRRPLASTAARAAPDVRPGSRPRRRSARPGPASGRTVAARRLAATSRSTPSVATAGPVSPTRNGASGQVVAGPRPPPARRITNPAASSTMTTPITELRIPPQSNTSVSPMPRPAVKMSQPTAAPTRPSTIDASHDFGPLMSSSASLGTSARPMKPATKPRSSAPITSNSLSRARCFRYAARRQSLLAVRGGGGALRRGSGAGRSTVAPGSRSYVSDVACCRRRGRSSAFQAEGGWRRVVSSRRTGAAAASACWRALLCGGMRILAVVLSRLGKAIAVGAIVAGLLLAAYALADGLGRLHEEGFSGEKEALKRLVGYPLGAAVAGSLVAVAGVVLMYLGERALDRGRAGSRDGARGTNGAR